MNNGLDMAKDAASRGLFEQIEFMLFWPDDEGYDECLTMADEYDKVRAQAEGDRNGSDELHRVDR